MKKWLKTLLSCMLCIMTMFGTLTGCGVEKDDGMRTVTFDLCTDLETNPLLPKEVAKGDIVAKPTAVVTGENPNNAVLEGWYRDKEYTQKWSFFTDTVEEDITLYAKWVNQYYVKYYLGDNTEKPFTDKLVKEGEIFIPDETLTYGYHSTGFYEDPAFTIPYVPQAITKTTNIYIQRSDKFYFSPEMMKAKFEPQAAPSGPGSKAGTIELAGEGDDKYVDINFGYSTAGDAHILMANVTVDISTSNKIRITMKNLGYAEHLKFYFVGWYDDTTQEWVSGAEAFGEDRAFVYTYDKATQVHMAEDAEWQVIEIDAAQLMFEKQGSNGVSSWGETSVLTRLRIDSPYVCTDENDLSNRLWIKSIEGIDGSAYQGSDDTSEVAQLLVDDNADEVKAVADAQADITGWVFPKNYASVTPAVDSEAKLTTYNKKNGLLLYAPFRTKAARVELQVNETINLYDKTTLVLRLRNYGYATNLKVSCENDAGREAVNELTIPARTGEVVECKFNMVSVKNWKDNLEKLTLEYTAVGVDNAILIESIEFKDYEMLPIPGFNFDDRNTFGLTPNEALGVSYSTTDYATKFTVINQTQAEVNKDYSTLRNFSNVGYESFALTYKMANEGITKVKVTLTVDGNNVEYVFDVAVAERMTTVELPMGEVTGNVTNFRMTFEGEGEIYIREFRFKATNLMAWDFGTSNMYANILLGSKDWIGNATYDEGLAALALAPSDGSTPTKYYYGALKAWGTKQTGNVPMAGATKVVLVYYNPGSVANLTISLGCVEIPVENEENGETSDSTSSDITPTAEEETPWDEKIEQPGYSAGSALAALQTNMAPGEWAAVEIDLADFVAPGLDPMLTTPEEIAKMALSCMFITHSNPYDTETVYIRLLTVI